MCAPNGAVLVENWQESGSNILTQSLVRNTFHITTSTGPCVNTCACTHTCSHAHRHTYNCCTRIFSIPFHSKMLVSMYHINFVAPWIGCSTQPIWKTLDSTIVGLPWWLSCKEYVCQCRRLKKHRFDPWVREIPWKRKWQPTPVFLPGKSHG